MLGSAAGGLCSAQTQLYRAAIKQQVATCIAVMATASDSAAAVPAGCKANQLTLAIQTSPRFPASHCDELWDPAAEAGVTLAQLSY